MATEEKSDGLVGSSAAASTQSQRQRFYVELKPGETTIVSWKKLLRERKTIDQCPSSTNGTLIDSSLTGTHCSSAHETPRRALDDNSEVGECNDPFVRNGRLYHQSTSSGNQLLKKRSVEMTGVEGKKNDDPSIKHVRLEDRSSRDGAKTQMLLDQPFTRPSIPPVVKDRHLNSPPSSDAHAPLVMYKKKSAAFGSKSNYPSPVNAMGTASTSALKTQQILQKTEQFSSGRSRIKGGILGDPPDFMYQKSVGKCVPLQTYPRCRKLMNETEIEVSFKNQHSGKGRGSAELLDVGSPGYNCSLQHSMRMKSASAAVNSTKPAQPFNAVLERAIGELERTVAESKSFKVEASDAHISWLTIERELPLEVNLKLGEVARLVQSSKEGISEELVSCLVNIIGKLVHGKTLKRLLRKFVMLKLSAKKERAEKFKVIKNEILAMVSSRQIGVTNCPDSIEEAIPAETYKLDSAMEDKLCDLYDLCVQGLSGDKGVEAQKLFIQGKKLLKSGSSVSPMVTDHNRTSDLVPSLKRKVTYSGSSCDLTSSPSGRTPPMKATVDHPVVFPKASCPPPTGVRQHKFPTERKLQSSAADSPTGQQAPEKKHVTIRFSLKPQDGTQRYEEQAAMDKLNCSRVDAHMTWKASSFPG
ncbi:hypothetical protein Cgig2_022902 [Carnegiea gigantea]|uniref:Wound-responsive family protein n=1 Tax=Carnegiea gigantea TaxID=171969 RepID=A0A9Q1KPG2_9CARY|nr:hypothetical protein Cgig2_022902 [Carnegiea gigantea]